MAHIFKKKNGSNKGLILFTHKEVFRGNSTVNFKDKILEDYIIGCHIGGYVRNKLLPEYVDYSMGSPQNIGIERVEAKRPNLLKIPISSGSFVESFFCNTSHFKKDIDILCIANHIRIKRIDSIIKAVGKIYRSYNKRPKVHITSERGHAKELENIFKTYRESIPNNCKHLFTIDVPSKKYSRRKIFDMYSRSKIFISASTEEGTAKALCEAKLAGLVVVYYKNMKGGGLELLNKENSAAFTSHKCIDIAIMKAMNNYNNLIYDEKRIVSEYREDKSIERLHKYFDKLFLMHNMKYDYNLINTDHLNFRLPAHFEDVPWKNEETVTNDITSEKSWDIFKKYL